MAEGVLLSCRPITGICSGNVHSKDVRNVVNFTMRKSMFVANDAWVEHSVQRSAWQREATVRIPSRKTLYLSLCRNITNVSNIHVVLAASNATNLWDEIVWKEHRERSCLCGLFWRFSRPELTQLTWFDFLWKVNFFTFLLCSLRFDFVMPGLVSCTAAKCWMHDARCVLMRRYGEPWSSREAEKPRPCARGGDANAACRSCTKAKCRPAFKVSKVVFFLQFFSPRSR